MIDTLTIGDKRPTSNDYTRLKVIDSDWLDDGYYVPDQDLPDNLPKYRYWSSADQKYTDTSMGGAIGVNAPPQFTRYTDIRSPGRRQEYREVTVEAGLGSSGNKATDIGGKFGMGRYYSEAVDDNLQIAHFEFGVPQFASLFSFLGRAVDRPASIMANDGRSSGMYNFGKAAGTAIAVGGGAIGVASKVVRAGKALLTMFNVPGLIIFGLVAVGVMAYGSATNKYYTVKPAMHVFFSTVNSLVTAMSVEMGFISPTLTGQEADKIGTTNAKVDKNLLEDVSKMLPGLIDANGFVDVFAIVNRAQYNYTRQINLERENMKSGTDPVERYKAKVNSPKQHPFHEYVAAIFGPETLYSSINPDEIADAIPESIEDMKEFFEADKELMYKATEDETSKGGWAATNAAYFSAINKTGVRFASFKVDYVGTVTESFSNSFKDIPAGGILNGFGQASRAARFSMSGGNLFGDKLHHIGKQVGDMVGGFADGLTFGLTNVVMGLLDGGMIELPQMWSNSELNLPVITYKTTLIPPSGHPYAILQNQLIPMAMLIAGVSPLSTGMNSYTAPFLCKLHVRGVQSISLGMMKSVSFNRGITNLGWDDHGRALGIEVTFSVVDLSTIMATPVNPTLNGAYKMFRDDESVLAQYILTLTGGGAGSTKFITNKLARKAILAGKSVENMFSAAYWGDWTSSHLWINPEKLLSAKSEGVVFKDQKMLPGQS